jgi:hypothetical protein
MKQQNYHCCLTVNVAADQVFNCIKNVSQWWTQNFEGSSENLNDVWMVHFGDTFVTAKVVEIIPNKKIVCEVTDCYLHWLNDKTEWKDTRLFWEVSTVNSSTEINFIHLGLIPGIECYESCIKGWDHFVKQSLFKLITEGKGFPERQKVSAQ